MAKKKAREAGSMDIYRDMIDSVNSIIIRWDMDLNFTFLNRYALDFFGLTREEALGRSIIGTIVPETSTAGHDLVGMCRDIVRQPERYVNNLNENMRCNGERVWISWTNKPVMDDKGNVIEILSVGNDFTAREKAEKALQASETRFRALIQNSSDIIRIIDKDGRIVYDSPSSEKILGYPPGTTIGRSPFDFIHPEDREKARHDLEEVFEKRNPGKPTEFRTRKADGSYLDVESIGVNLIGTPGIDGLVINTRPITERKQAEEDLKKAKAQAELYLDLMGHDINNLHQIAMGYLEFAKEMAGPEIGQKEFIDKPFEVLRRSARLIDNVRKLQKLREGVYVKGTVDVMKVLANALGEYRDMPGKTITVDYQCNEDCQVVANDLLSDVFSNLIDNAIKHARDNPCISVSLKKVLENDRDHYRIAVEDNGPGIPDSMKGKIFNRLLEGDSHSRGMGLGLYMVKTLVEDYGGRVWVEDRIDGCHAKGARFVVMLPAAGRTGAAGHFHHDE